MNVNGSFIFGSFCLPGQKLSELSTVGSKSTNLQSLKLDTLCNVNVKLSIGQQLAASLSVLSKLFAISVHQNEVSFQPVST